MLKFSIKNLIENISDTDHAAENNIQPSHQQTSLKFPNSTSKLVDRQNINKSNQTRQSNKNDYLNASNKKRNSNFRHQRESESATRKQKSNMFPNIVPDPQKTTDTIYSAYPNDYSHQFYSSSNDFLFNQQQQQQQQQGFPFLNSHLASQLNPTNIYQQYNLLLQYVTKMPTLNQNLNEHLNHSQTAALAQLMNNTQQTQKMLDWPFQMHSSASPSSLSTSSSTSSSSSSSSTSFNNSYSNRFNSNDSLNSYLLGRLNQQYLAKNQEFILKNKQKETVPIIGPIPSTSIQNITTDNSSFVTYNRNRKETKINNELIIATKEDETVRNKLSTLLTKRKRNKSEDSAEIYTKKLKNIASVSSQDTSFDEVNNKSVDTIKNSDHISELSSNETDKLDELNLTSSQIDVEHIEPANESVGNNEATNAKPKNYPCGQCGKVSLSLT